MNRAHVLAFLLAGALAAAVCPDVAVAQRWGRITSVEIVPAEAAAQVGEQVVFLANAYDAANNPVPTATFEFTSSNRNVATVDVNGIATGVGPGTVIITARTGTGPAAKSATATLTVSAASGTVQQPRISARFDAASISDVIAAFSGFSGRSIITGEGVTGTVTAEFHDQPWDVAFHSILGSLGLTSTELPSGVIRVDRRRVIGSGLAVSRTRFGLGVGERFPVAVQLLDERRQPMGPATDLRWTSSADGVARVANGQVQGLRPGRARLTARASWDSTVTVDVFVVDQLLAPMQRGGRWDLYTFGPDRAPRFAPVAADAAVELDPAWAPDLTRIAYVAAPPGRPTNLELFVANADGSESRRVTNDSATVAAPAFVRPNGEQIVFQSNRGGRAQLYIINRDGTGRRQLTSGENPNTAPDVSPDGAKLVFVSLRQLPGAPRNYDIWEMNRDGTGERRLTTSRQNEDSPQYSADGRSVYFVRDEGSSPKTKRVYRQSLPDTTAAQPITPVGMFVSAFSVKPDGGLLVLTRIESVRGVGDVPRVVFFNPATGAVTPVVLGPGEQLGPPVFRPATPRPR